MFFFPSGILTSETKPRQGVKIKIKMENIEIERTHVQALGYAMA